MNNSYTCGICSSVMTKPFIKTSQFAIIECKNCKIAFTFPSPLILDYEQMDFHSGEVNDQTEHLKSKSDLPLDWQRLISLQVEIISQHIRKDATILDVGCGEGILLEELKKAGFRNVQGIEPSRNATIRAQKKGLEVQQGYFTKDIFQQKFDLVMMSHVFEHIPRPLEFLNDIETVLTSSGALMFTQTNYKGLIPMLRRKEWYAWVPDQHFWHFTLQGLKKMLMEKEFTLRQYSFTPLVQKHDTLYRIASLKSNWIDQFVVLFKKN